MKLVLNMIWLTTVTSFIGLTLVNSQGIRPGSACDGTMVGGTGFQYCVAILGNVDNSTALADICSYYAEAVHCSKRDVDSRGGQCTLDDIEYIISILGFTSLPLKQCNVSAEVGSICSRDRLAMFALLSCRPYLTQLNTYPDNQCQFTDYLFRCVKTSLGYMQTTCSETEVKDALTSGSASTWLQTQFPLVNLTKCFKS